MNKGIKRMKSFRLDELTCYLIRELALKNESKSRKHYSEADVVSEAILMLYNHKTKKSKKKERERV